MAFPRRTLEGLAKTIADLKQMIQNVAIPQGTIWWFHNRTTAPVGWVICNGNNGTPNLIGRYPLGATSGIGSTVEAGLPNITGTFGGSRYGGNPTGAFYGWASAGARGSGSSGGALGKVKFDASKGQVNIDGTTVVQEQSVYGKSNTVTPPSVKLLPCMKL